MDVRLVVCWLTVLTIGAVSSLKPVYIAECKPNKFFWKDSNPDVFYACLKLPKRAFKMKCRDGTFMCNTGEQAFTPCNCTKTEAGSPAGQAVGGAVRLETTRAPPRARLAGHRGQPDGKMSTCTSDDGSLPACGCPDLYQVHRRSHMFGGVRYDRATTLRQCQDECLRTRHCLALDWVARPLATAPATASRCFLLFPEVIVELGMAPFRLESTDHYRRMHCASTPMTSATTESVTSPMTPYNTTGNYTHNSTYTPTPDSPDTTPAATDGTTPTTPISTTTIPDSGCPYTYQEYAASSHPFGRNVTSRNVNRDAESCKYWCLLRSYCVAVDFNSVTRTCYYLREIKRELLTSDEAVTHFRKVGCPPPLSCWSVSGVVRSEEQLSITDPDTPQTSCKGVCFARMTLEMSAMTIYRGCQEVVSASDMTFPIGCHVDTDLLSLVCYCDTPRCNGLSVSALASQIVYLPLDGDLKDHSGIGHHGTVPAGYSRPAFTCLDKAVNCSALFRGSQCVSVDSLAMTSWGSHDDSSAFIPQASFAVWFKRISLGTGHSQIGGIFGNSIDSSLPPTWRVISAAQPHLVGGGVLTDSAPYNTALNDYRYVGAVDGDWHSLVMVYDGQKSRERNLFPLLQFYADGRLQVGNARSDQGPISVRNQPVSIGCVMSDNFIGFIDEARIFSTALSQFDVRALSAIRNGRIW